VAKKKQKNVIYASNLFIIIVIIIINIYFYFYFYFFLTTVWFSLAA